MASSTYSTTSQSRYSATHRRSRFVIGVSSNRCIMYNGMCLYVRMSDSLLYNSGVSKWLPGIITGLRYIHNRLLFFYVSGVTGQNVFMRYYPYNWF